MLARLHLCPDEVIAQFPTDETIKMRLVKAGKLVSDVSIQAIKRIVGIRLTQIESISLLHPFLFPADRLADLLALQ